MFDGRVARRRGRTSELGSLLDPVADKLLVLSTLIMLVGEGVCPAWMVAAIVAREFLVSGLRLAALERGVVMRARPRQAEDVVALTWLSGLDYARLAPGLLSGRTASP